MRKLVLIIAVFVTSLFSQELPPPVPAPVHITDDYGPRNLSGEYDWHGGIDYRASPGTAIRAVEGGEISVIDRGSRAGWYIRIHGAHAYWTYMHLFSDNSNPTSGNWEAVRDTLIDPNTGQPNPSAPVPIFIQWSDRENRIADNVLVDYDYRGRRIRHNGGYIMGENGDTLSASGSVGDQDTIGPSGNSGGVNQHLHISAATRDDDVYDINPLYFIYHSAPRYSIDIIEPEADATFFHLPGVPEGQQVNERIGFSLNSTLGAGEDDQDSDRMFIYFFKPDTIRTFDKAHLYSKIVYGGLPPGVEDSIPFPTRMRREAEANRGSLEVSGVDPQGAPPGDDDLYFIGGFSEGGFQFNSKINKAKTGDALLNKWASADNKVAKFKDGWTDMVVRAYSIRNWIFEKERRILLDNFVPYVYAVMVTSGGEVVHNAMWLLNATQDSLKLDEKINKNVSPGDTLKFKIYFSEMMDTTNRKPAKLRKSSKELDIDGDAKWIDEMTWEGSVTIPEDDEDWKEGEAVVNISCRDIARHLPDRSPGQIARRNDDGMWENYDEGVDVNHKLYIGEAPIVTSTDPSDKTKEVPIDKSPITIVFSQSMEQTATQNAVSIVSERENKISFTSSWKDTVTLEIILSDTLDYCLEYTCTVTDSAISKDSVKLDGDEDGEAGDNYIFEFTTESPELSLTLTPATDLFELKNPGNCQSKTGNITIDGSKLLKEVLCKLSKSVSGSGLSFSGGEGSFTIPAGGSQNTDFTVTACNEGGISVNLTATSSSNVCATTAGGYSASLEKEKDHPDDNQSPGKMEYPTPWITRTQPSPAKTQKLRADSILPVGLPDIGILLSGWVDGYGHILGRYGIETLPIKPDLKILNKTPHTAYGIRLTA